jgi:DNA-binding MarR family transcriptional regulator
MTTPILNGQVLGVAANATRAVLDRLLAEHGTTANKWIALRATAVAGGELPTAELVDRLVDGLKIGSSEALGAVSDLVAAGLLASLPGEPSRIALTDAGRGRYEQISEQLAEITGRIYADLPPEDLAAAGRVLTIVAARANAELAA